MKLRRLFIMTDAELKERFIELRAEGVSFDSIAKELNKSKTTLIKWQRELESEINNFQYSIVQGLIEKYKITKQKKIEFYGKELDKIYNALEKKNYEELSIKQLHDLRIKLDTFIEHEKGKIGFYTGDKKLIFDLDEFEKIKIPL